MTQEGIIQLSNSFLCAPVVYVPKSKREIRICVDFVQLSILAISHAQIFSPGPGYGLWVGVCGYAVWIDQSHPNLPKNTR